MDNIEKTAIAFTKRVEAIKNATVDYVYDLGGNLSRQELATLIGGLDFNALVNQLGYESSVDELIESYVTVLKDLNQIAPLSEEVLEALANTDRAFYLSKGGDLANTMKQELSRGALLGIGRTAMKSSLAELGGYRPDQIQTLVDTAVRTFGRTVNVAMMDELPDTAKYFYFGPVDDKTRDICLEMAAAGEMTQDQIVSQFGSGVLTDGGGYNCRHEWRLVTSKSSKLEKSEEAEKRLEE